MSVVGDGALAPGGGFVQLRRVVDLESESESAGDGCRGGHRPKNLPASGPKVPSGNLRLGSDGTGIPNRSCHRCQLSMVNTPAGAVSSTFRNSSKGT